jgi:anti-anti-sigma regulatory factor
MDALTSDDFVAPPPEPPPAPPQIALDIYLEHGVLVVCVLQHSLLEQAVIQAIHARIAEEAHRATTAVLVDCANVSQRISSGFLGMLASLGVPLRDRGLPLGVCGLNQMARQAIEVTRLDWIVGVYASLEEGIYELGKFNENEITAQRYQKARDQFRHAKLENQINEAVASERRRLLRLISSESLPKLSRRGQVIAASFAVVVLSTLLIAWQRGESPEPHRADAGAPVFGVEQSAGAVRMLSGSVAYQSDESKLPDVGALVLLWPVDQPDGPLVKTDQIYAYLNGVAQIPGGKVFVARASDRGEFALRMPAHSEYHLLIVSRNAERRTVTPPEDLKIVTEHLADPERLLDRKQYRLARCKFPTAAPKEISWSFE